MLLCFQALRISCLDSNNFSISLVEIEWTDIPLDLSVIQCLLDDLALKWCAANLPMTTMEPAPTLMTAVCYALGLDEAQLHLMVKRLSLETTHQVASAVEHWLQNNALSHKKYLSWILNLGSKIDGLFLWLASLAVGIYLNIIHSNGVWTTRRTGIPNLQDLSVAITLGGFLVATEVQVDFMKEKVKVGDSNIFLDPIQVYQNFVPSPVVLNQPVQDLQLRCDEIGLVPFGEAMPLHVLLAEFARFHVSEYHAQLVAWLHQYRSSLNSVHRWLAVHGLDFEDYVLHLSVGGMADGLEAWLVSVAINTPLNVVMEDTVWSLSISGIDFQYYTLVLTSFGMVVQCLPEENDKSADQQISELQVEPCNSSQRLQGGLPVAALKDSDVDTNSSKEPRHDSDMDTDVDFQFSSQEHDHQLPNCLGVAKARVCPVCSVDIFSGLALIRHMKFVHKAVKPYKCEKCDSCFNNLQEMSSHVATVHRLKTVRCKHCQYSTTMCSKMRQHVCKHTKGFHCSTCNSSFQTERLLRLHQKLHKERQSFDCEHCDNFYFSLTSLWLHVKGKHGVGYMCTCGQHFDTPNQQKHHRRNCAG